MEKLLHFRMVQGPQWPYPLVNAFNEAETKGKLKGKMKREREYIGIIYYKIRIISAVLARIDEQWGLLLEDIKGFEEGNVYTEETKDKAYAIKANEELVFRITADLECLLFEFDSLLGILSALVKGIYKALDIVTEKTNEPIFMPILKTAGMDTTWYCRLNKFRNHLTHLGALALCAEIGQGILPVPLIMKKHVSFPSNDSTYIPFDELKDIKLKVARAIDLTRDEMVRLIKGL